MAPRANFHPNAMILRHVCHVEVFNRGVPVSGEKKKPVEMPRNYPFLVTTWIHQVFSATWHPQLIGAGQRKRILGGGVQIRTKSFNFAKLL
jgi:hypothetical protein